MWDVALWAVRWSGGRFSVFSGPGDAAGARDYAAASQGLVRDRWPGVTVKRLALLPVRFLELGVASRLRRNEPKSVRVRMGEHEISWTGPHRKFAFDYLAQRNDTLDLSAEPPPRTAGTRLWSCIHPKHELVIFNAPCFEEACRSAERALCVKNSASDCEPVERVEVQLEPYHDGYAPICYRLWIEGHKVGWPEPEAEAMLPGRQPPLPPLNAATRVAIPRYDDADVDRPVWPLPLDVH